MIALGCVTGRFQPVHRQHMELFEIALTHCAHLVVAVTNPDPGAREADSSSAHRHTAEANPFTFFERLRLLAAALAAPICQGRISIVPFDLTRPQHWTQYVPVTAHHFVRAYTDWERHKAALIEQAGYQVTVLDGNPAAKVSGTDIRRDLRAQRPRWHHDVPATAAETLIAILAETPLSERR